jgi:hypothetical protein
MVVRARGGLAPEKRVTGLPTSLARHSVLLTVPNQVVGAAGVFSRVRAVQQRDTCSPA